MVEQGRGGEMPAHAAETVQELTADFSPSSDRVDASMLTRRAWLRSGIAVAAGAAAVGAVPERSEAQASSNRYGSVFSQLGQQVTWRSPELRLLRRISLGITAAEVSRVQRLGYAAYLEEQLAWEAIDDRACEEHLARGFSDFEALTPRDTLVHQAANTLGPYVLDPYQRHVAERAILGKRQLQERMVEFWTDHFHVNLWVFGGLKPFHDLVAIRPLALASVGALVRATMRSPAMLHYLDQVWSTKWGVNENYARELMELHTVGVEGGYTQQDVHGLARILTGWSVDERGEFEYKAYNHDFGAKSCFGMTFPETTLGPRTTGMEEGVAFGEHLIRHPKTKRYIATKLLKWFVSPTPSATQVQAVVNAYGEEGDIKAMLRVVLSPANVQRAPAKLKRPFHFVVSAIRGTGAEVRSRVNYRTDNDGIGGILGSLGHAVGNWQTPDGYPDRADFWAGMIVDRWNATEQLAQNGNTSRGSVITDFAGFVEDGTVDGVVAGMNRRLFGGEMSAPLATEIRNTLRSGVTTSRLQNAVRLALISPEFQFY